MIQRIQTVFLVLAIVLNLTSVFVPLWKVTNKAGSDTAVLSGMGIEVTGSETKSISMTDEPMVLGFTILAFAASLFVAVVIFMFKNRPLQMRLAYLSAVVIFIQTILLVVYSMNMGDIIPGIATGTVQMGYFMPLLAVVFIWMAARKIKKDEEMVRGMDRLR